MSEESVRPEHPRPDWKRPDEKWENLNGRWHFAFDDQDIGMLEGWWKWREGVSKQQPFDRTIVVPFAHQTELSGVYDRQPHEVVWYGRSVKVPASLKTDERVLLHFGAVDYHATVWVDSHQVTQHTGGHVPFHVDITHILRSTDEEDVSIVVRASDPPNDVTQPRGKQYWQTKIEGIWYHPTTGIWQTVWMEHVPYSRINRATVATNVDLGTISVVADLLNVGSTTAEKLQGARMTVDVAIDGVFIASSSSLISNDTAQAAVYLSVLVNGLERPASILSKVKRDAWHEGLALWSPDHPTLYTLRLSMSSQQGEVLDRVDTYTGMRKIHIANGKIYLNNERLFQALSLDQGYWPQAGLTAPSDEALQRDIILMKEAGLNGCRKHQKVEDPRFLYHADRLGYLVWSEMANAYDFSQSSLIRFQSEWTEAVIRNINHPSVIAWTPINESWGVPKLATSKTQRDFLRSLYYLTKTIDPSRPVITNDGWEQGDPTDIVGFHDYGDPDAVKGTVANVERILMPKAGRDVILPGDEYKGQPIILTEMGGFSLKSKDGMDKEGHWGYAEAGDEENLMHRIQTLVDGVIDGGICQGFCYTQTTDTEQEVNGILTQDRQFKIPAEKLRAAFGRRPTY
ncbi:hypothetical protein CBS101457_001449 [Exobasidium rhododendri]|nr:hypothetical protein CBS101457_001449 [Exobasidium rhododendri]